jgi:hypothetical protein
MKTIVVSGARSNVGKTTLAVKICRLLSGSVCVKLGHGEEKEDVGNVFYRAGTPFEEIQRDHPGAAFIVVESNRILEEIEPDLAVYIPADDPKPSASLAEVKADLIRGCDGGSAAESFVAERLGIDGATAGRIVREICRAEGARGGEGDE